MLLKIEPKWRNFTKYGHLDGSQPNYVTLRWPFFILLIPNIEPFSAALWLGPDWSRTRSAHLAGDDLVCRGPPYGGE